MYHIKSFIYFFFIFILYMCVRSKAYKDEIICDKKDYVNVNYYVITITNEIKEIIQGTSKDLYLYTNQIFSKLTTKIDTKSSEVLNNYKKMIIHYMKCSKFKVYISEENKKRHMNYIKKLLFIKSKIIFKDYDENVFEYHHGLKDTSMKVKKYISEKNIMDIGAFHGDSIYILRNYTNKLIYSYEISEKNIEELKKFMKVNNVNDNDYVVVNKGMSNHLGSVRYKYENGQGPSLIKKGKKEVILTTIDEEVRVNNLHVGFIKIDVEGEALNVLRGGKHTIRTQRPVISVAVYHYYDELMNTRSFFDNELTDYKLEYQLHNDCRPCACEINLFAYPITLQ